MNPVDRIVSAVTRRSRLVIVALLLTSAAIGAGAAQVDSSSSLDQFQSQTVESQKLDYVQENFDTGPTNATTVQVIVRGDGVLQKSGLLAQLRFERALRENETVNATLSPASPPTGLANLVAVAAIQRDRAAELRERGAALDRRRAELDATAAQLTDALNRTRSLQRSYDRLNRSYRAGEVSNETYRERAAAIEANLTATVSGAVEPLNGSQAATFRGLAADTRGLQSRFDALNASYRAGEINQTTYRERAGAIREEFATVYRGVRPILASEYRALAADARELERESAALQNASMSTARPPLSDQIAQVESMNESEIDATLSEILDDGRNGGGRGALAFVPTSYERGSTTADATMLLLTQRTAEETAQGSATERIVASQLAVRDVATDQFDGDVMVFGSGIISDEIDRSMTDSLAVVGPLALLFVLIVLVVAYRDLVDILLGVTGIGVVLAWTFGFMGWADIAFNQIFIAVPVLLIGLSIDYAIHVFMRHREERANHAVRGQTERQRREERGSAARDGAERGDGIRSSMRVALASVGVALVLVTATTAIGFLSNLTSSVPPIREFGVVSAFGILAALVVFGGLVPAAKVEIDEFLEARGFDRRKRAFGTGGGRLGRALAGGATAARRAPWAVVALALLLTAAGAYGAAGVDTSFAQEDFLADDPPAWMDDLPEPFRPGEYHAKDSLDYVYANFGVEGSQGEVQIPVEGNVTDDGALERVADARAAAAEQDVTVGSGDEAAVRGPLSVMRRATENETFNQTFHAADTDGNGVPDRNLERVYDQLFATAPDQASSVVYRTDDGDYEAVRLVVSVRGDADGDAVTAQMRDVAAVVDGDGLTATATGQPIVFKLVTDQLLRTVVESLLLTLAAVFVFLMATYRVTDDSAALGFVTLLPVAFSVAWILGTMFLLGIPFNVLTGMITSLSVGLGVAYSIHVSERYAHELDRQPTAWAAMRTTVTGTGGALLGSAATTVGGFGVLAFAILPSLRQFGVITGLSIVYAFLASVLVLPSLLAYWTRYAGPANALDADGADAGPDDRITGAAGGDGDR